ncbi:MAG: indolepyruvate ferredoxin oxidoreductase subunit alpha [Sulfolobales archaeon]
MLGNEAIARGAIEAGVSVATAYPGTPSSEIIGSIEEVAEDLGIYVEWSINEKVAMELAWAAAISGVRALTAMKHVGLNVAADALMSSAYTGVEEGLVIVSADDPSMWSSQNEQDNRIYGMISYIPVFEPENPSEAKELVIRLFDLSSEVKHPVILRTTTRVSHVRAPVRLGVVKKGSRKGSFSRDSRYVLVPSNARRNRIELLKRWERIKGLVETLEFNRVYGDGRTLIITPATTFPYVYEVILHNSLESRYRILKLSSVYPIPEKMILNEVLRSDRVIVLEELEPFVEMQVRSLLNREKVSIDVISKDYLDRAYEMTVDRVARILSKIVGEKIPVPTPEIKRDLELPSRPPVLCSGCPYRPLFFELRKLIARERVKVVYSGDIGCYSLGYYKPFEVQDTIVEMGGSIGLGNGFSTVLEDVVVISIIGDSTFFHAGIPALINSVYNMHPQIILVLDNMSTAMTGHQPTPTNPLRERRISIEELARGIGVRYVKTIDPFDADSVRRVLSEAIRVVREERDVALIVARRKCALLAYSEMLRAGEEIVPYYVDPMLCVGCGICYNLFACPAIIPLSNRKASIDPEFCIGCGSCVMSCPFNAIKPVKPVDQERLKKYWM